MSDNLPIATVDHPRFMGMRGRPLDLTVSVIATTGFLLFGYDRKSHEMVPGDWPDANICGRGCYVWYHLSRTFHELFSRNLP